jgi:hypothetical protein
MEGKKERRKEGRKTNQGQVMVEHTLIPASQEADIGILQVPG